MGKILRESNWQRGALIALGATLLLTLLGPFKTFSDLSFGIRTSFWTIIVLGCWAIFRSVGFLINYAGFLRNLPKFHLDLITIFISSFPQMTITYHTNMIFRDLAFKPENLFWIWSIIFATGIITVTLNFSIQFGKTISKVKNDKQGVAKTRAETDANIMSFFAKLQKGLGTELVSLSMHDHYIEVVTNEGKMMLYMKFFEAMDLLKNYDGMRVHRSHWVSRAAIKSFQKEGRKSFIKLTNGQTLPVSEKYKAVLKASGPTPYKASNE